MSQVIDVSMIIVCLNAANHIERAIKSLINQRLDQKQFEIIIVDGGSVDNTIELSTEILLSNNVTFQILKNDKKILSSGWNLGIKAAKGKYVIRIDAHSEIDPDYVITGICKINDNEFTAGAGGVIEASASSFMGNRIASVLSSPIGVGNSLFRIGVREDTKSDTAVYAVYKKEIFSVVGLFDENLERNQDVDFHSRLKTKDYHLITSPQMMAKYYSRTTVLKFAQQAFNNGFWVIRSGGFYARHLAPLTLLLTLSMLAAYDLKYFFVLMPCYLTIVFLFFLKLKIFHTVMETLMTFLLHLSYGLGSCYGIARALLSYITK